MAFNVLVFNDKGLANIPLIKTGFEWFQTSAQKKKKSREFLMGFAPTWNKKGKYFCSESACFFCKENAKRGLLASMPARTKAANAGTLIVRFLWRLIWLELVKLNTFRLATRDTFWAESYQGPGRAWVRNKQQNAFIDSHYCISRNVCDPNWPITIKQLS